MTAAAAGLAFPDLPPGYELVVLRQREDAFRHACDVAPKAGAGTLVWIRRLDVLEFAVVLEPEEPLALARRVLFAGMNALADAVGCACPPDKPIEFEWPGTLVFDRARLGGAQLGWPPGCGEEERPDWLVFGAMLLASKNDLGDPGHTPDSTSLEDEDCEFSHEALIESFARNLMRAFHVWSELGFPQLAAEYLSRLSWPGEKVAATIAENGDLFLNRAGTEPERHALLPALENAAWLDRAASRPRL